jgi:hypothetical protein
VVSPYNIALISNDGKIEVDRLSFGIAQRPGILHGGENGMKNGENP